MQSRDGPYSLCGKGWLQVRMTSAKNNLFNAATGFLALSLVVSGLLLAPAVVSAAESPLSEILQLARKHGLHDSEISFSVVLPDGQFVEHRADVPVPPASCMKLLVSAAVLDGLGPDFKFKTDLVVTGELKDQVLDGDIVVIGRGDPAISGREFSEDPLAELRPWVKRLNELGIRIVRGQLLADDRYLQGPSRLPDWPRDQLDRWYCAPSGALNLNDNCFGIVLKPISDGSISVALRPANGLARLVGEVRPTSLRREHLYRIDRAPGSWTVEVSGRFLDKGSERVEWVSVPDPTRAFLGAFHHMLAESGIVVEGKKRDAPSLQEGRLAGQIEHSVNSRLPVFLKRSQNLYGDCMLRVLGREMGGDGSFQSGSRSVTAHVNSTLGSAGNVVVRDGSGLSARNRLRAGDLTRLMVKWRKRPWFSHLQEALPVAAVDGTLEKRFRNTDLAGRLRAKTGHISGVSALAGSWRAHDGVVSFSLFFHGRPGRAGRARNWQEGALLHLDSFLGGPPSR